MQSSEFQAALALAREGEFRAADERAQTLADPLERVQAQVYLRHHAGDLEGALGTCREGLLEYPLDAYLLATRQELALALARPQELVSDGREAEQLRHSAALLEQGQLRAKSVVLVSAILLVGLLLWAARPRTP